MSRIFGPVIQQGYIVPDVKEAAKHWIDIGVGPFFLDEGLTLPGTYHGEKYEFGLTPAFSYSGDQQIELIQPDGPAPSIYKDYLEQVPEGGLQHVAFWAEDPDGKANFSNLNDRAFFERMGAAWNGLPGSPVHGDRVALQQLVDAAGVVHVMVGDEDPAQLHAVGVQIIEDGRGVPRVDYDRFLLFCIGEEPHVVVAERSDGGDVVHFIILKLS